MRLARWWAIGMALLLAACNGNVKPTDVPLPDPQALLSKAAAEVQNAKSVRIKLQLAGAPQYVDPPTTPGGPGNTIAFVSADGAYQAPDRVQAKVVARILGVAGEVDVIAIGDDQWMKNKILTADQWIKQIFSPGFNAQKLVTGEQGIQSALKALQDVKMIGRETVDGVPMYHISAHAPGADVASLTFGLIRSQEVQVDIYIVVDTGRADRLILVQPDSVTEKEPKPSTWTLELFDYNADIQIAVPTAEAVKTP